MSKKHIPADASRDLAPRMPTTTDSAALTAHETGSRRKATLRRVPVFRLQPHECQPVERHAPENVSELMISIESHDLLQPPLLSQRDDGRRVILAGHRRVKACQLLALDQKREDRIPAYVIRGLSAEEELDFVLAEQLHRDTDYSAVALAENIGRKWIAREQELGRDVTIRDLADCIPSAEKTAVAEYLAIYRGLADPRLEPLVRLADKAGKSLLYRAIQLDEFRSRKAALEAFVEKGTAAMRAVIRKKSNRGRPRNPFTRRERGDGYDLTIRYRPDMAAEDAALALKQVEEVARELRFLSK